MRVILFCGIGASSGFMAKSMQKYADSNNLNLYIEAHSESEIENYVEDADVVMIGPHLAYLKDELDYYEKNYNKTIIVMKGEYYSTLDGKMAIDHMLDVLKKEGKKCETN